MEVIKDSKLAAQATQARERFDAHVREMVAWHFDPATGSPFWLERAETLFGTVGLDEERRRVESARVAGAGARTAA